MSVERFYVCDHCGKVISNFDLPFSIAELSFPIEVEQGHFIIVLRSPDFADSAGGLDHSTVRIDLCDDCAAKLQKTLDRILEVLEYGSEDC